jgi:hypothetical protein
MLTPMQKIALVLALVALSMGAGLFALAYQTRSAAIIQTIDGVKYYETRDAGLQPLGAEHTVNVFGSIESVYGRVAAFVPYTLPGTDPAITRVMPASLPNTSGQCETEAECLSLSK